ncbi:MAG: hydroxyacid dehydrogenase [Armatimonadetes bacterium]|nr:hydroxyacid dehydrogenase [Armatimonadota bacterium]
MNWRVLGTSRAFWANAQEGIRALRDAGCEVVEPASFHKYSASELIELLRDCDASLASSESYTPEVFDACPKLKIVSRCGVGYDAVDVGAATRAGVVCTNTPGAMVDAVADFTVGLILMCARRMGELDALVHAGGWAEISGTLVYGKTLGLVGFGQIGRAVARRLAGFDMRILVHDPFPGDDGGLTIERVSLAELLSASDFASLHAPSTPETARMFGREQFAAMRPTAYFINTSRGALVDEAAIIEALNAGEIAGAALDVTAQEPLPPDHALRSAPNLILTAHNAFNAREAASRMCNMAAYQALSLMRGEEPEATINPEVYASPALRCPRPRSGQHQ